MGDKRQNINPPPSGKRVYMQCVSNLKALLLNFLLTQLQAGSSHLRKGSSVIFISSISGFHPQATLAMYGVTKTALLGLTKVLSTMLNMSCSVYHITGSSMRKFVGCTILFLSWILFESCRFVACALTKSRS